MVTLEDTVEAFVHKAFGMMNMDRNNPASWKAFKAAVDLLVSGAPVDSREKKAG